MLIASVRKHPNMKHLITMKTFKNIVLNIPHSSTLGIFDENFGWPRNAHFLNEVHKLTDWYTDFIFHSNDEAVVPVVFPLSRVVCDAERLPNDPLEADGQGIVYTRLKGFRREVSESAKALMMEAYERHQSNLAEHILPGNQTVIIDCHSFSEEVCPEVDVCIGYNEDWSKPEQEQIDFIVGTFQKAGYKVGINTPYSNSITPKCEHKYKSVMIEVNKRCYLRGVCMDINTDSPYAPKFCGNIKKIYKGLLGK